MSTGVKNTRTIHIMEPANNCEAFMSRIFKKDKPQSIPGNKTNLSSCSKFRSPSAPRTSSIHSRSKATPRQQTSGKNEGKNISDGNSNTVHKELYNDNSALVEVTVKTSKPKQRANSTADKDRETWGKVLQTQNSEKVSTFSSFDPLRTLHFLAKELQYKLQNELPDDGNILQIINDMQNALKRVPPEIASSIQLQQQSNDNIPLRKSSSSNSMVNQKVDKVRSIKPLTSNRSAQTLQKHEDTELIQKIMEDSTLKLEASCRQMEMLCGRLKSEKDNLEEQLKSEKDNVQFLKKRVGDLEAQSEQLVTVTIKRLEEEKNELQTQVNKLTDVVDSQSVHTNMELKNVTQELRQCKLKAEQECTKMKHQLTLANMEKEKYIAILAVRDRQINEIRAEMAQLQDVVNEQLMDIHNNALSELPSNNSLVAEEIWPGIDNKENVNKDTGDTISCSNRNDNAAHLLTNKPASTSFKELPSGDSTIILQEIQENYYKKGDKQKATKDYILQADGKHSIRDMFAELKKQAFAVTTKSAFKS